MNNKYQGLANPYSAVLLVIMLMVFAVGTILLFNSQLLGFVVFAIGAVMASGFRILSPSPREIGLITFLGQKTDWKVEGLTLLLDQLGIDLIGVVVFKMRKTEKKFPITSIRCNDGVRMKGEVAISIMPDDEDDEHKTGTEKLRDFDDIGHEEGFFDQIEQILTTALQSIVEDGITNPATGEVVVKKKDCTYRWVETHPTAIAAELLRRIKANRPQGDTDELDDSRGLGAKFLKIQVPLTPINKAVINADEDATVERLQRKAEVRDTLTINKQVKERMKMYERMGVPNPNPVDCRQEIVFERLAKDKKVDIVQGGRNVNVRSVGNTD
jgi:hypothetical protein